MANMTKPEARTRIRNYLDDDGTRWPDAEVDVALATAIDQCVNEYLDKGGSRLNAVADITCDASGEYNLESLSDTPVVIVSVRRQTGGRKVRVPQRQFEMLAQQLSSAQTFNLVYAMMPSVPADDVTPMAYGRWDKDWPSMDAWICATAALDLATKDNEENKVLFFQQRSLQSSVLTQVHQIRGRPLHAPVGFDTTAPFDTVWAQLGDTMYFGYGE